MHSTPDANQSNHLSRRQAVRWGASAALVAWATPTVLTWTPSPAHAGTPSPTGEAQASPRPTGELADTGAGSGLLAAAGVTAIAAGAAALRWQRHPVDHPAEPAISLPLPPRAEPPDATATPPTGLGQST